MSFIVGSNPTPSAFVRFVISQDIEDTPNRMADGPDIARALGAARAVALANSVACEDAVVVAARSNVLVHLKPAPVVARVMTGTAVLHDDIEKWLAREVAVGAFLAERAYGGLELEELDDFVAAHLLYTTIWQAFAAQTRPFGDADQRPEPE